jgi:hypothetical protein
MIVRHFFVSLAIQKYKSSPKEQLFFIKISLHHDLLGFKDCRI